MKKNIKGTIFSSKIKIIKYVLFNACLELIFYENMSCNFSERYCGCQNK